MGQIPNENDRQSYNMLIGKNKDGEYVFLDEAFEYSDGFRGLVGTKMVFHTESEYEEAREDYIQSDDLKYLWKDAVANDATEESFRDWKEEVIDEDNELIYDSSYRCAYWIDEALEIIDKHEYEETGLHVTSEFSDCVGGGRCFYKEMLDKDYRERVEEENFEKFKELYEKYEKPNDDRQTIEKANKRFRELYKAKVFDDEEAKKIGRFLKHSNVEFAEKFLKAREKDCDLSLNID